MPNKTIIVSNTKYTEIIRTDEIIFCQAAGSYAEVILINKQKITVSKNLHWFEERCNSDTFCRIHKSFLVNIIYVKRFFNLENNLMLSNGIKIPISKSKKKQFWEMLEKLS